MKDRRTKILALVTLSVAGVFVLDKGVSALVLDPWSRITLDITKTEAEIRKANTDLKNEDRVRQHWNKIKDLLDEPRPPDVHTNFLSHLDDLFKKAGVAYDVSENPQVQQQGDFKEYVFETKFKLTWPQFVDLLMELHNSKEFLKPLRITIASQYEKEDRLDVDLKVSTIEHSPAPVRAGLR